MQQEEDQKLAALPTEAAAHIFLSQPNCWRTKQTDANVRLDIDIQSRRGLRDLYRFIALLCDGRRPELLEKLCAVDFVEEDRIERFT